MKIIKLKENYLDDLHKYNKKRQKGMSPFCYLNPNAGDVPTAIGRFNNSVDTSANVCMMGEDIESYKVPTLEELQEKLYIFITVKEYYVFGDYVKCKLILSKFYTSKGAIKLTIKRADDGRMVDEYRGNYDDIIYEFMKYKPALLVDEKYYNSIIEDYDKDIIKDDPETVEEIKEDLTYLGNKINSDLDFKQENLPPEMRLKSLDLEVDHEEDSNDYYLILYIETYEPFTGEDFRRYFVPEVIDSIKNSMGSDINFEFYVEINCYDTNSKSYSTQTVYVDNIKHIRVV